MPDDQPAKPAPDHDPGIAGGNTARVYNFEMARLTRPCLKRYSPAFEHPRDCIFEDL
jgi:hypothetical protein